MRYMILVWAILAASSVCAEDAPDEERMVTRVYDTRSLTGSFFHYPAPEARMRLRTLLAKRPRGHIERATDRLKIFEDADYLLGLLRETDGPGDRQLVRSALKRLTERKIDENHAERE